MITLYFSPKVRMFGSFRLLTKKIEEYLTAETPGELFAKILERLEEDFEKGTHKRYSLGGNTNLEEQNIYGDEMWNLRWNQKFKKIFFFTHRTHRHQGLLT